MPIQKVQVVVSTTSQTMSWGSLPKPTPPTITMNGNPLPPPAHPPSNVVGWQLVVIDAHKDMTKPESLLLNEYVGLTSNGHEWGSTYQRMYAAMVRDVLTHGNVNAQLVIAASYGLDANMPPSTDALAMMLELGSGPRLQYWETHVSPGSEPGSATYYVGDPVNYVLIGYSSWSYGQGYEVFDHPGGGAAAKTTLTATLSNIVGGEITE